MMTAKVSKAPRTAAEVADSGYAADATVEALLLEHEPDRRAYNCAHCRRLILSPEGGRDSVRKLLPRGVPAPYFRSRPGPTGRPFCPACFAKYGR